MKFESALAYSFGRGKKGTMDKTDPLYTPGPGQYAPAINSKTEPKWKIGSESRGTKINNDIPGPGQYSASTSTLPRNPQYSIASKAGAYDPAKFNCSPGPGMYEPQLHNGSSKFSMRIKPNSAKVDLTPGPGNYNIRTEKDLTTPTYKFGTEKKSGLDLAQAKYVPGPGNYEAKDGVLNKTQPKFSFGKELRGDSRRPMTPGPGQYQYKEFLGKEAPKISMSSKLHQEQNESRFVPGPGQYDGTCTSNKMKAPAYKIGTAQRLGSGATKFGSEMPGPGQYVPDNCTNHVRPKTPSWVIGTGKRPPLNPGEGLVPGPGNYNIGANLGFGPKFTMVGKNTYGTNTQNGVPGPGQYNENKATLIKNPAWKMGTGTRDDNIKKAIKENVPGPGNYEAKDGGLNKTQPKFSFGKELRGDSRRPMTPGPGQYQYKEFLGKEAPKISMSSKLHQEQNESRFVPGPGQYDGTCTANKMKAPAYKIGTAQRLGSGATKFGSEMPGPGQYVPDNCTNHVRPKTPSWVIGTGKRPPLNPGEGLVPGPGNYNIGANLGFGPKFTMVGKNTYGTNTQNGVPGPGQYDESNATYMKNPAWKMGTGTRDDNIKKGIKENVPGPGMYDNQSGMKGPKFGFGTEKRGMSGKSDTPGPGQYHIPCAVVDVNDYIRNQGRFDPNFRYI